MKNENSKISLFAVVIRTKNIERLRNFYRDVLLLGPPTVDSNYWVEFKIDNNSKLILELLDEENENQSQQNRSSIDWALKVDDINMFREHLQKAQLEPIGEELDRFDKKVIKYLDPDGNLIHIIAETNNNHSG